MRTLIPLFLAALCLAPAAAAQSYVLTVQPIQVRADDGTLDEGLGYFLAEPIAVEAVNKVFAQANIAVEFLPTTILDESDFLVIDTVEEYFDLRSTPGHGQHPDSLVINLWLAQDMRWCDAPTCAVYIAAIGYNGLAVMGEHVDVPVVVSRALAVNMGLDLVDQEDDRNNLMHPMPYAVSSVDDIYPDGLGRLYLNEEQVAIIRNSPYSVPDLSSVTPAWPASLLSQNVPNPFNPQTTISFDLPQGQTVNLGVYDISGRLVDVLLDNEVAHQGRNEVVWRGRDGLGRTVPSGTYFYRLQAGEYGETKRMTLLK